MDKVNKLTLGRLLDMPSHDAYSIPIHLRTTTVADISHKQKEKNTDNQTNQRVKKNTVDHHNEIMPKPV